MDKNNLITIGAAAIIIIMVMAGIMYWMAEPTPPLETKTAPRHIIPSFISIDGEPELEKNRIYFRDYSNMMHGLSLIAQLSRSEDLGNERYREGRMFPQRKERAESWLNMVALTSSFFSEFGKFETYYQRKDTLWTGSNTVDLADYPMGVYAYHMHHRGDWFDDITDLPDRLYRLPGTYISNPGQYLLAEHYRNGRFYHSDDTFDHNSMAYGMAGIHGHTYAWVRWKKPGGSEDMGKMTEERLTGFLGHDAESLTNISREIALTLLRQWDEPHGIYNFDSGYTWSPAALGALIRGHKAVYDMLYMFGNDDDRKTAKILFDHAVTIFERIEPLIKPWGLASQIEFNIGTASATSSVVDLYSWYEFLNHMDSGYSWVREREGTAPFFTEFKPEVRNRVFNHTDAAILSALDYHSVDGRLVSTVSYDDGSVIDKRTRTSIVGLFLTFAGNHYASGSSFAPAGNWDSATSLQVSNTTELYDFMVSHARELELLMLLYK